MNGGETLRYIRTTLGLKQKDIRSQGLRDISGIENGVVQMSSKIAIALEKKLNEVIKERDLKGILDFEITSLIFKKGLDIDIEECFKQMSKDYKIDRFLELNQDKYEFSNVKRAIEILAKDYGNNLNSISRLSYEILGNSKDENCIIYAYLQLQRVAYYRADWNSIITYYDVIKDNINCCQDTKIKDCIYMNTATAYCSIKQNELAKEIVSKIKYTITNREYIDNLLFNINLALKDYDEALKYNYKVLSYTDNHNTELLNKFNICYVASKKNDVELFTKYLDSIGENEEYVDFTREQFLIWMLKSCNLLNITDENKLAKIFKISKNIYYKDIECIDYFKHNADLISKIIINNDINIDAQICILLCKNSDNARNKLINLCNI